MRLDDPINVLKNERANRCRIQKEKSLGQGSKRFSTPFLKFKPKKVLGKINRNLPKIKF